MTPEQFEQITFLLKNIGENLIIVACAIGFVGSVLVAKRMY